MATLRLRISPRFAGSTLTVEAVQAGAVIDSASGTVSEVGNGFFVTATLDLSSAAAGQVDVAALDPDGYAAWAGPISVDGSGNIVDGSVDAQVAALHDLVAADQMLEDVAGVRKLKYYRKGTSTELITAKTAKQPNGSDLTDPTTQLLAGYKEE